MFANETAAKQAGFASADEILRLRREKRQLFELYDDQGQRIDYSQLPGRRAVSQRAGDGPDYVPDAPLDTGLERWMYLQSVPIDNEKNEPELIVSIMQDITDQKRLEALRRQEEQRLRVVLDNLGILSGY